MYIYLQIITTMVLVMNNRFLLIIKEDKMHLTVREPLDGKKNKANSLLRHDIKGYEKFLNAMVMPW